MKVMHESQGGMADKLRHTDLNTKITPIDIITKEEVDIVLKRTADFEELHEVVLAIELRMR